MNNSIMKSNYTTNNIMFARYESLEKLRELLNIIKKIDDYVSYNILEIMLKFELNDRINLYDDYFIKKELFKFTYNIDYNMSQYDVLRNNINYLKFIDSIGKLDEYEKRFICKGTVKNKHILYLYYLLIFDKPIKIDVNEQLIIETCKFCNSMYSEYQNKNIPNKIYDLIKRKRYEKFTYIPILENITNVYEFNNKLWNKYKTKLSVFYFIEMKKIFDKNDLKTLLSLIKKEKCDVSLLARVLYKITTIEQAYFYINELDKMNMLYDANFFLYTLFRCNYKYKKQLNNILWIFIKNNLDVEKFNVETSLFDKKTSYFNFDEIMKTLELLKRKKKIENVFYN